MAGNLRDHLEAIRGDFGRLTPEVVVGVASDPEHPLHDRFEWDDTVAAHRHRLTQARGLIRLVRVQSRPPTQSSEERSIRFYHSVPQGDGNRAYTPIDEIVNNPYNSKLLLQEMEREWMALYRRWSHMVEFMDMVTQTVGNGSAA